MTGNCTDCYYCSSENDMHPVIRMLERYPTNLNSLVLKDLIRDNLLREPKGPTLCCSCFDNVEKDYLTGQPVKKPCKFFNDQGQCNFWKDKNETEDTDESEEASDDDTEETSEDTSTSTGE